jgi:hypothetical protein
MRAGAEKSAFLTATHASLNLANGKAWSSATRRYANKCTSQDVADEVKVRGDERRRDYQDSEKVDQPISRITEP